MSELVRCTVANLGAALVGESLTASDPPPVYGALRLHVSLLIGEIDPGLPAGTLAAYLLNAVAPSILDRSLSEGDADVTLLADAARALVRASPAAPSATADRRGAPSSGLRSSGGTRIGSTAIPRRGRRRSP
jgi:hypothetical protein